MILKRLIFLCTLTVTAYTFGMTDEQVDQSIESLLSHHTEYTDCIAKLIIAKAERDINAITALYSSSFAPTQLIHDLWMQLVPLKKVPYIQELKPIEQSNTLRDAERIRKIFATINIFKPLSDSQKTAFKIYLYMIVNHADKALQLLVEHGESFDQKQLSILHGAAITRCNTQFLSRLIAMNFDGSALTKNDWDEIFGVTAASGTLEPKERHEVTQIFNNYIVEQFGYSPEIAIALFFADKAFQYKKTVLLDMLIRKAIEYNKPELIQHILYQSSRPDIINWEHLAPARTSGNAEVLKVIQDYLNAYRGLYALQVLAEFNENSWQTQLPNELKMLIARATVRQATKDADSNNI